MKNRLKTVFAGFVLTAMLSNGHAALPDPGMKVEKGRTALVITDPQNDFLSPKGVTWGVVGKSVEANNTVENIEKLLKTAKANDIPVFVSPHCVSGEQQVAWRFRQLGRISKLKRA